MSGEDVTPQETATDDASSVCPYLGMVGDAGSRLTFPSRTHLCHAGQPAHIGLAFQADFCLGGGYPDCARYQRAAAKGIAPATPAAVATLPVAFASGERLQIHDRERTSMTSRLVTLMLGLALVGTLVALGVVLGIIPLPDGSPISGPTPTPSISAPPTNGPTDQPTGAPTTSPAASPAPTPSPTPAPTPTPTDSQVLHVVQPGETLTSIATRYGVTIEAIVAANGITDPNVIQAGDVLIIPLDGASPGPGPTATSASTATPAPTVSGSPGATTYVVQAGDTLQRIANRFGVTVQAIQDANGITDPNKIFVGQQLIIPPPP